MWVFVLVVLSSRWQPDILLNVISPRKYVSSEFSATNINNLVVHKPMFIARHLPNPSIITQGKLVTLSPLLETPATVGFRSPAICSQASKRPNIKIGERNSVIPVQRSRSYGLLSQVHRSCLV